MGSAYTKGKRPAGSSKPCLRHPPHLRTYAPDGCELVTELGAPLWGEPPAGLYWSDTFVASLVRHGWRQAEGVPCLFYFDGKQSDARMITKVDDFAISETRGCLAITNAAFAALRADGYEVERRDKMASYAGLKITRDRATRTLMLSMPQKVTEMLDELAPGWRDAAPTDALPGADADMRAMLEALRLDRAAGEASAKEPANKADVLRVQTAAGWFRYLKRVHPLIGIYLHRLSCLALRPPKACFRVIDAMIRWFAQRTHHGIVYGGAGMSASTRLDGAMYADISLDAPAPQELAASSDATYGTYDIYAYLLTYNGAHVDSITRRVGLVGSSSMQNETKGMVKAMHRTLYARNVLIGLGVPPQGPTLLACDNKAAVLVANNAGSSARSLHFLRMYVMMQERIASGDIVVQHVSDADNPSDVLTKWVDKRKFKRSDAYFTNMRAAPAAAMP